MNKERLVSMTDDEWRGYITCAVENISVELKEIKAMNIKQDENFNRLKTRVATIGGTVALVVSLIITAAGSLIKGVFGR